MDQLWQWTSLQESSPPSQSVIADPENYDLLLKSDFTFEAKADCKGVGGTYTITATEINLELGPVATVLCEEGSLSDQYIQLLGGADAWALINDQLFLGVGDGAAVMGFQAALQAIPQ